MNRTGETYARAAADIAVYVQTLAIGDLAPPFSLRDENGRPLALSDDWLSGRPMVVLCLNQPDSEAASEALKAFAAWEPHTVLVALSADSDDQRNRTRTKAAGFGGPIPADSTGAVFASFGLHKGGPGEGRAVLLSRNRQVRAISDNLMTASETFMAELQRDPQTQPSEWVAPHAPVLAVPNVLSRPECAALIAAFETDAPFMVRPPRPGELAGNYVIPVYEHNRQDRMDLIIKDKAALGLLDQRLFQRVVPMIQKAFAFDVTRREDFHIARYEGERGGHKMGHRDNVSAATAYRRFAFSMNLNDDFDGGGVAFREYGDTPYKTAPGTALIFSSALLHEVEETTKGVRYSLISHLFNESTVQPR